LCIVDAQAHPGREADRDGLFRRVSGPLVRVGVAPRLDPGAVAEDGRQAGRLGGIEHGRKRPGPYRTIPAGVDEGIIKIGRD
jgi:hypothetical protein